MSRILTVSDDLYADLAARARRHGVSIEDLLRIWPEDAHGSEHATSGPVGELQSRTDAVRRSITLYEQLAARHGMFPDSTDLLRDDRAR